MNSKDIKQIKVTNQRKESNRAVKVFNLNNTSKPSISPIKPKLKTSQKETPDPLKEINTPEKIEIYDRINQESIIDAVSNQKDDISTDPKDIYIKNLTLELKALKLNFDKQSIALRYTQEELIDYKRREPKYISSISDLKNTISSLEKENRNLKYGIGKLEQMDRIKNDIKVISTYADEDFSNYENLVHYKSRHIHGHSIKDRQPIDIEPGPEPPATAPLEKTEVPPEIPLEKEVVEDKIIENEIIEDKVVKDEIIEKDVIEVEPSGVMHNTSSFLNLFSDEFDDLDENNINEDEHSTYDNSSELSKINDIDKADIEEYPEDYEEEYEGKYEIEEIEETEETDIDDNDNYFKDFEEKYKPENYIYDFPSVDFLIENPKEKIETLSKKDLYDNAKKLEETLQSFNVKATVVGVNKGPTVTRYEVQPASGVKVNKISSLADDLALNLAAESIRIQAPIPGKNVVGIEVPNEICEPVYIKDILKDQKFKNFHSKLAFGVGKDITGNIIVADLGDMPHLLIAGATGSGKSVCINTLIVSLLYKSSPEDVKLILIDPKVVELSIYNGIPHLLIPVVTDPKKAAGSLNWAVNEMEKRYNLFAAENVRDLKGYNAKLEEKGQYKEPSIVIIIDELADLMMNAPKEVEISICRIAQKARAAGIHLIIATQRPSVDIITGVIKANIPSRLAFAVSSHTDSKTILDTVGAEKLMGKGDMLFYPRGTSEPRRLQGPFITDDEVKKITDYLKAGQPHSHTDTEEIIEEITGGSQNNNSEKFTNSVDEIFEDVVEYVFREQKISASAIQRVFRVGYNRASRIVDELEHFGLISESDGAKPRKILLSRGQWNEKFKA
ncbi:MAG: DNA translocase FtsK [Lachnospirales bacterium]